MKTIKLEERSDLKEYIHSIYIELEELHLLNQACTTPAQKEDAERLTIIKEKLIKMNQLLDIFTSPSTPESFALPI